jgi:hypothetical protein
VTISTLIQIEQRKVIDNKKTGLADRARRPGSYPPNYPLHRILAEDPTPGQPLHRQFPSSDLERIRPLDTEIAPTRRVIDHRQTAIGQPPRVSRIVFAMGHFRPLDAPPPRFNQKVGALRRGNPWELIFANLLKRSRTSSRKGNPNRSTQKPRLSVSQIEDS